MKRLRLRVHYPMDVEGHLRHGFQLVYRSGPVRRNPPIFGQCVRTAIKILGTDLTGATSVTFNGTPATFTVVSSTEIKTTVPSGAITGKVKVTTPSGTLISNVNFRVSCRF